MQVIEVEQGSSEWLSFREGKITGTKLGKLFAKSRKEDELYDTTKPNMAIYELVAERLAIGTADEESPYSSSRERGHDLEGEAVERAEEELKLKLQRGQVWQKDDKHIASPDAWTKDRKKAVEIKCLSSAKHVKAIYEDEPPAEYFAEYINYFLVNEELETLYVFLYDPRFIDTKLQAVWWTFERKDIEPIICRMQEVLKQGLNKVEEIIGDLTDE